MFKINTRNAARRLLGPHRYASLAAFYHNDKRWYISAGYWRALRQLRLLKDKHKGERCFIIGNGPSLARTNLEALAGEYTFGLNRIYLLFDRLSFRPSYYVCVNPYLIEQTWEDILTIPCPKFISLAGQAYLPQQEDIVFLRTFFRPAHFSYSPARGIWESATVTYCAMQLAYYIGFHEVILIGVDHNFSTKGEPNELVVSTGDDSNHFDLNYFGQGFRWQLPDLAMSEIGYRLAKEAYERCGRRILDATLDGCLEIFPKVSFNDIIQTKNNPAKL